MRRAAIALALLAASCGAPGLVRLPSGAGAPFPEFTQALEQASAACRSIHTLTAAVAVSGHAGGDKVRGRLLAGASRPASLRLEGVAPFGPPLFVLAAADRHATLFFPRSHEVVRDEPGPVLEALTRVPLTAADALAALTGCPLSEAPATSGRVFDRGRAAIEHADRATTYLARAGSGWRIVDAVRGDVRAHYDQFDGDRPSLVRLVASAGGVESDLTLRLSDVDLNVDLAPATFTVDVPPGARSITLDDLRSGGALSGRSPGGADGR